MQVSGISFIENFLPQFPIFGMDKCPKNPYERENPLFVGKSGEVH
jgi:hypothetical protein